MASDNDDWLQRFLQADWSPEHYPQRPAQGVAQDTPQPPSYPDPYLGIPSPYQALMTMTNNNPSHFFGPYSQAGNVIESDVAATRQTEWIAQLNGQLLDQVARPPTSQSAPPVAHQQTQAVTSPPYRPATQSASPVRQPAAQSAPTQAYQSMPQSAPQAAYVRVFQLSPQSANRLIPQAGIQKANGLVPRSSPQAAYWAAPPPALEPAHQPAIESVPEAAYRPVPPSGPQPSPQPNSQPIPDASHRPVRQDAGAPAPQLARQGGPQATYGPSPSATSEAVHRPAFQQVPRSMTQLVSRSAHQTTCESAPNLASQPVPQSAPIAAPASPGSTFERPSAPATITPSLFPGPTEPSPAISAPASRLPQYSNHQSHTTKKRRIENKSPEAIPLSQNAKRRAKPNLSAYKYAPSQRAFLWYQTDIIQPFDEVNAAEKITYDTSTIARDVLIAVGHHPTEPGLNYHLQDLKSLFGAVNASADLETFRWDVIETQVRAAQPSQAQPPTLVKPQPRQPHRLQPLNTIKQPTQPVSRPSQTQPANSPSPHQPLNLASKLPQAPVLLSENTQATSSPTRSPPNPPNRSPPVKPSNQPLAVDLPGPSPPLSPPKQPPAATACQQVPAVELPGPSPAPSPSKQAPGINVPKQTPAVHQQKRPVVRVEVPAPPKGFTRQASESKMVARRQALRAVADSKVELRISYPVFACKWKNCQAELHNLDVLKQHMLKVHMPFYINCEWAECTNQETLPAAKLFNHVKAQHIEPIAWKLGDGPSIPATGEEPGEEPRDVCVLNID